MALSEEDKMWLMRQEETIVQHLDPERTMKLLRKMFPDEFDSRDVEDILVKYHTSHDRTEALLLLLHTRPVEALKAFRTVITILHPSLAAILQPVRYRVLWVCPSAKHAAMAVHLLKQYTSTDFILPEDGGLQYMIRRSIGSAFGDEQTLIKLVFPVRPEMFQQMLDEVVKKDMGTNLVIMTGVCESRVPSLTMGQVVIPSCVHDSNLQCPGAERVRNLEKTLRERLKKATWHEKHDQFYSEHTYIDYCAAWLGRLHFELTNTSRGQSSIWLDRQGFREGGLGNEVNRSILAHRLPLWETGRLARHVLQERRTWRIDHTSPLGLTPKPDTANNISERIRQCEIFPGLPGAQAPSAPVFNSLSSPGGGRGSHGDVTDSSTCQFYKACSNHLGAGTEWLACLCVCYDATTDSHELTSFTAVTMAMEIVQMFMSSSIREL